AYQYKVDPFWLIQTFIQAPEASRVTTWHTQLSTAKYTYTITNHLLFEAGMAAGGSPDTIKVDPARIGGVAIQELGGAVAPPLTYRAPTNFDFDDRLPSQSFNVSASYVTGSHNAKFGVELQRGHFLRGDNNDSTGGIWYVTRDYAPLQVVIQSPLAGWQNNLNYNLGFFAQDRWTVNRLTLSGGVRVDLQNESTEPFTAAPHRWLPNRHDSFAAVENVPNWKDIDPRVSAAYDLFGTGKTAIKASASRSVRQDSIAIAAANNPASTLQTQTARTWTDNGNFVPDCDLTNGAAQDNRASGGDACGPWLTPAFGSSVPGTIYDPAILNGWGVRPWNWEFSAGVQHEMAPRLSVSLGYFRRIFGNFQITDNEALTAADFTQFSITLPTTDPRLPNAGSTLGGFYDVNRIVAARNVVKDASAFGRQQEHWDGIDLTFDARPRGGFFLQAGVSTGKAMTDNCEIVNAAPEVLVVNTVSNPAAFCHQESPWLAQYKTLASYTLPYDVRISGTFQSLPGPQGIAGSTPAGVLANNVYVGTAGNLGRNFTAGSATLALIQPYALYGDRLNEFDLRFTKTVNLGHGRVDLNADLFNAFNSDAILVQNNTFGAAWQRPLTVIQPRFVKLSARWDF
ncbi:MAG TPA: hypothetical protein VKE96_16980, partial [Vicinamibacterales bacterium]|nr:hypothetical protein [Vicinamibacterales bacterium]